MPICLVAGQGLRFCRGLNGISCARKSCFPQNCLCLSSLEIYFIIFCAWDLSDYTYGDFIGPFVFLRRLLQSLLSSCLFTNIIRNSMMWLVCLPVFLYCLCSRNQLSALPACLCGLPLKVLIASNNKLGSLPEEIGQLKQLMELVCY